MIPRGYIYLDMKIRHLQPHSFGKKKRILLFFGFTILLLIIYFSLSRFYSNYPLQVRKKLNKSNSLVVTEERFVERRKYLNKKCAEAGLNYSWNDPVNKPNAWEFFVNPEYNLVWCNVFKAASTSWIYNFNILAGYSKEFLRFTKRVAIELAREKYPRPSVEELANYLNDSVSFIIVRHPFERLLSAYRDKLENNFGRNFHSSVSLQIVKQCRDESKIKTTPLNKYPSFEEFIRWLLYEWQAGNKLDEHWTPVLQFCTPCQVRFDIIAKFETLQEDQNYLIRHVHLEHIIKPEWKNPTRGPQQKDVIKNYFQQLTKGQIADLYNMFKYDFELFDYSPIEYLGFGKQKTAPIKCNNRKISSI